MRLSWLSIVLIGFSIAPALGAQGELPGLLPIPGDKHSRSSRMNRLHTMRVAPVARLSDAVLSRQRDEGYNTITYSDTLSYDPVARRWMRTPATLIASQLAMAKRHGMSVVVCMAAAEPIPIAVSANADAIQDGAQMPPRTFPMGMRPKQKSRLQSQSASRVVTDFQMSASMVYLEDEDLIDRLNLWESFDDGQIIGMYMAGDDPMYMRIPKERQDNWRVLAGFAVPQIPVMGMFGEACLDLTPEDSALYYAPNSADVWLGIAYPYNLGWIIGHDLDHVRSKDPDGDVIRYLTHYLEQVAKRYPEMFDRERLVIPVIQTFVYQGETAGKTPRARDILLQVRVLNTLLRTEYGQSRNFAMGYFFGGLEEADVNSNPWLVPLGIYDVESWASAVAAENAWLMAQSTRGRDGSF